MLHLLRKAFTSLKKIKTDHANFYTYKISHIVEEIYDDKDEKWVVVRVVGKSTIFKMRPNEILANDDLTETFGPKDVRTLTYLGYHNMNDPKYKIISEKTAKGGEKLYLVKQKGNNKIQPLKHEDMISEKIRKNLSTNDAFKLGKENSIQETIKINKQLTNR